MSFQPGYHRLLSARLHVAGRHAESAVVRGLAAVFDLADINSDAVSIGELVVYFVGARPQQPTVRWIASQDAINAFFDTSSRDLKQLWTERLAAAKTFGDPKKQAAHELFSRLMGLVGPYAAVAPGGLAHLLPRLTDVELRLATASWKRIKRIVEGGKSVTVLDQFEDGTLTDFTAVVDAMEHLLLSYQPDEVVFAFECFALGELRITEVSTEMFLNAEPDYAGILLFGELAIGAWELRTQQDNRNSADDWMRIARLFVRIGDLFLLCYGANPSAGDARFLTDYSPEFYQYIGMRAAMTARACTRSTYECLSIEALREHQAFNLCRAFPGRLVE